MKQVFIYSLILLVVNACRNSESKNDVAPGYFDMSTYIRSETAAIQSKHQTFLYTLSHNDKKEKKFIKADTAARILLFLTDFNPAKGGPKQWEKSMNQNKELYIWVNKNEKNLKIEIFRSALNQIDSIQITKVISNQLQKVEEQILYAKEHRFKIRRHYQTLGLSKNVYQLECIVQ